MKYPYKRFKALWLALVVNRVAAAAAPSALELYGPYVSQNEGFRLSPYQDTAGHFTVGIGHKLLPHEAVKVYTAAEVHELFKKDLLVAVEDARAVVPSFDSRPLAVRTALVDMAFNLGRERLLSFKRMLHAINYGAYHVAATDIKLSLYHKQSPARAERNMAYFNSVP